MRDRQRFAGERALVEDRAVRLDEPVDRHDLSGLHEQQVAPRHLVDRRRSEHAVFVPVREPRRALQQLSEIALRPAGRTGFEGATAREHDGDDRAGEVLADDEGADEREHSERVDAETPVPSGVDHPPARGRDAEDRVGRPDRIRGATCVREVQQPACREQGDRDDEERELTTSA